ncbi:MAG: hypothetical protein AAFY41_03240 [Bacteroidota bacterium]
MKNIVSESQFLQEIEKYLRNNGPFPELPSIPLKNRSYYSKNQEPVAANKRAKKPQPKS